MSETRLPGFKDLQDCKKRNSMKPYTLILCLLLSIVAFLSCAEIQNDPTYTYCVLEKQQMCISGTFTSGDCSGKASDYCNYSGSKKCESIFNPSTHFCYDGNVYSKCDSIVYNPTKSICQGGIANPAKCGSSSYNPLERGCCASTIYDPLEKRCQNDAVESRCGTGDNFHNPLTQFCNGNEVLNKCDGSAYNLETQRCQSGVIETKCGTGWYNNYSENKRCYNNVVETRCGTSYPYAWYDSTNVNMRCENDVFESKCGTGNNFHNPATQFCNGNEAYDKCGSNKQDYDPATQRCINDVIETKCGTGNSFYNSATQFCNGNSVYNKCSGYNEYNPVMQFCNGNSIYSKCNGQDYVPANQKCESNVVVTRCGDNGSYYYDATNTNLRCRSDIVETKCGTNGWYDTRNSSMRCQDNVVESKCGSGWYNLLTQFCNVNEIFSKCGGNIYDPYTQECAGSVVRTATYSGTFTDSRDSKTYKWTKIGIQKWMAENLNYRGTEPDTIGKCYDNDITNCDKYGRLYDWATAMALPVSCNSASCSGQIGVKHKGVCPLGWHLPSNAEFATLMNYVENNVCSNCAGKYLKAASGWMNCGPSDSGSSYLCEDTYGFSALPGGYSYSTSSFSSIGSSGYWWSASEYSSGSAYYRYMGYSYEYTNYSSTDKSNLYNIRCMED
jgi:uncharacterized protein (TIGR02145 family)